MLLLLVLLVGALALDPATWPLPVALAVVYVVIFVINVVPALMPPTWSVIAFFYIHGHLPLLPLAIGGAVMSSAGRYVLARGSQWLAPRLLSHQRRANLRHLGAWLNRKAAVATPLAVLAFSFGPIPSNEVFIAAGLTEARLGPILGAFFVGRAISYYVLPLGARTVVNHVEDLFSLQARSIGAIVLQIVALALLVLLTRIDWPKLLHLSLPEKGG